MIFDFNTNFVPKIHQFEYELFTKYYCKKVYGFDTYSVRFRYSFSEKCIFFGHFKKMLYLCRRKYQSVGKR